MSGDGPTGESTPPTPEVLAAVLLAASEGDRAAAVQLLLDAVEVLSGDP